MARYSRSAGKDVKSAMSRQQERHREVPQRRQAARTVQEPQVRRSPSGWPAAQERRPEGPKPKRRPRGMSTKCREITNA